MQTASNVVSIRSLVTQRATLQHDKELLALRSTLTSVYLERLQESHTPIEQARFTQIYDIGNSVTDKQYSVVIEGAIRDLQEASPTYVPDYRRFAR